MYEGAEGSRSKCFLCWKPRRGKREKEGYREGPTAKKKCENVLGPSMRRVERGGENVQIFFPSLEFGGCKKGHILVGESLLSKKPSIKFRNMPGKLKPSSFQWCVRNNVLIDSKLSNVHFSDSTSKSHTFTSMGWKLLIRLCLCFSPNWFDFRSVLQLLMKIHDLWTWSQNFMLL